VFRLSSLLLGLNGLGLSCCHGIWQSSFVFVGLNLDGAMIVALNLDEIRLRAGVATFPHRA
jgi:hypothetical protein